MEAEAPPINEIVGLLGKFAPGKLRELQQTFPDLGPILEVGEIAGKPGPLSLALAKACVESLKTISTLCDKGLDRAKRRLSSVRTLRFVAGAASALGSGSVLGSINSGPVAATWAGGVIALVGSIATLGIEFYERIDSPDKVDLLEVYTALVDSRQDVNESIAKIEVMIEHSAETEEKKLDSAIRKANQTCRRIRTYCSAVGITTIE